MVSHCPMNRVTLIGCNLRRADFSRSDMIEAGLRNTALIEALFVSANMNGADLSRCSMSGADFTRALIRDSMWTAANMTGANFDQASLHRADFTFAKRDDTTRFPKGFDHRDIEFLDVGV